MTLRGNIHILNYKHQYHILKGILLPVHLLLSFDFSLRLAANSDLEFTITFFFPFSRSKTVFTNTLILLIILALFFFFSCSILSYLYSASWSCSLPLFTQYTRHLSLFLICINSQRAYFSFCHCYCKSGKEKKAKGPILLCNQYCGGHPGSGFSLSFSGKKGGVGAARTGKRFHPSIETPQLVPYFS